MNLATVTAINALTTVTNLLAGGRLTLYNGTLPATPETTIVSPSLEIAHFTFNSPAFGTSTLAAPNEQQSASFVSSSVTPTRSDTVAFARATMLTAAWAGSGAYVLGQIVTNSSPSGLYLCLKGGTANPTGGPTGSTYPAAAIIDGTCVWSYIGPATATTVADFTVGTGLADITIGTTVLSTAIAVTITQFILQIPAV